MHVESMPESLTDALVECVKAAGGSKVVGVKVFPEKLLEPAQRHLLNCLRDGRAERLNPEQVVLIFRLARDAGCHVGMRYLAHTLGYCEPVPVEPRDEVAELQRQFVEASKAMQTMAMRLEQLQPQVNRADFRVVA